MNGDEVRRTPLEDLFSVETVERGLSVNRTSLTVKQQEIDWYAQCFDDNDGKPEADRGFYRF